MILIEQFIFFYLAFNWLLMLFYKLTALKENESPLRGAICRMDSFSYYSFSYKVDIPIVLILLSIVNYFSFSWNVMYVTPLVIIAIRFFFTRKFIVDVINRLINCRFCLESHLGLIVSCVLFYYTQEPMHLIFGYQTVAFNILIEQ